MKNNFAFCLVLLVNVLLFSACNSYIPISKKVNPKKLIVDYYKGDHKHLYFVKPALLLENKENKQFIAIDFTYDYKKDSSSLVIAKFSIFTPQATMDFKDLKKIQILPSKLNIVAEQLQKLAAQPRGNGWEYRYAFSLPYQEFTKLMEQSTLTFVLTTDEGKALTFHNRKTWTAYQNMIQQRLLPAIEFAK